MANNSGRPWLGGVIEGFYGKPWTNEQRLRLFKLMEKWGLNSYLYCPKDDIKHRTRWRLPYDETELAQFSQWVKAAAKSNIRFLYGIGPGLDIEHCRPSDLASLKRKIEPLLNLGIRDIVLLFDDIAPRLSIKDINRFGSVAHAQAHVTNTFHEWLIERHPEGRVIFCPTPYCARMCNFNVTGSTYMRELGDRLDPRIDIFWTGPEIVSHRISVGSIKELSRVIRRSPILWDNLHANDYDLRRIYLGPYDGRPVGLREVVAGVMSNPNCEFELNRIPLQTLSAYIHNASTWKTNVPLRKAIDDWRREFVLEGGGCMTHDEIRLLVDCFNLPHENGQRAKKWVQDLEHLLSRDISEWNEIKIIKIEQRIRRMHRDVLHLFERLTALKNRDLLYALYRHAWELKEEVLLLDRYLDWVQTSAATAEGYVSGEHLPGTYRGGLVAQVQKFLPMQSDGSFNHRLGKGATASLRR